MSTGLTATRVSVSLCSGRPQNSEKEIGVVGLVMILSGIVGALLCGVFLDKTHKFK